MAYTPTVWATGDVITAEKLNKAENGIAAASVAELPSVEAADQGKVLTVDSSGDWIAARNVLVVTISDNTLSATWQEINDAMPNVYVVMEVIPFGAGRSAILSTLGGGSVYNVFVQGIDGTPVEYKTTTADGYPTHTSQGN